MEAREGTNLVSTLGRGNVRKNGKMYSTVHKQTQDFLGQLVHWFMIKAEKRNSVSNLDLGGTALYLSPYPLVGLIPDPTPTCIRREQQTKKLHVVVGGSIIVLLSTLNFEILVYNTHSFFRWCRWP
jgi:hypothetical protein